MKLGLLSDVHGNVHGLEACLAALGAASVDRVLCAGDILGYYPFLNAAIDLLVREGVESISGNHEAYFFGRIPISRERFQLYALDWAERNLTGEHRSFLADLPESRILEVAGIRLAVFHGSPWSVEEYVFPDGKAFDRFEAVDADVVVLGHTHIPMLQRVGATLIVNPGSCGQPRDYNPLASCAVLDTDTMSVSFLRVAYDIPAVLEAVEREGLSRDLATILTRTERPQAVQRVRE